MQGTPAPPAICTNAINITSSATVNYRLEVSQGINYPLFAYLSFFRFGFRTLIDRDDKRLSPLLDAGERRLPKSKRGGVQGTSGTCISGRLPDPLKGRSLPAGIGSHEI